MDHVYRFPKEAKAQFSWAYWDGEAVLYNSLSGETHRLLVPAGHILRYIESNPSDCLISADKVTHSLPEHYSAPLSVVENLLAALCLIGLLKNSSIEDRRPLSRGTVSSACG